jgi:hypothetical protein
MEPFVSAKIAAVLLLAATSSRGADQEPPPRKPLMSAEYAKWHALILPNPGEQSYRKIPWRRSVLHGIIDAQKNDKPVMIVLMNGHPLGCT